MVLYAKMNGKWEPERSDMVRMRIVQRGEERSEDDCGEEPSDASSVIGHRLAHSFGVGTSAPWNS